MALSIQQKSGLVNEAHFQSGLRTLQRKLVYNQIGAF